MSKFKDWSVLRELNREFMQNIENVYIFENDAIFIIANNNNVYGFGLNKYGCVGLGHCNEVKEPQIIDELCDKQVCKFAYNTYCNNALALTKNGDIYSWGRNNFGQLANKTTTDCFTPKLIEGLNNEIVTDIRCGSGYCLALTENGSVYCWGQNSYGYLGIGDFTSPHKLPNKVSALNDAKIVEIDCGSFHSLALTADGVVYGWGDNSNGQLVSGSSAVMYGILARKYTHTPIKLNIANNISIRKVRCGRVHSLVLSTDGDVYAFGGNDYGQIGDGSNQWKCDPIKVVMPAKCVDIAAFYCTSISIAKSENCYCYVWGNCVEKTLLSPKETCYESINEVIIHFAKWKISYEKIGYSLKSVITARINDSFNNSRNSDIAFKIDSKLIYAHKVYLKMVCKHFETMFAEHNWSENSSDECPITQYSYSVYYSFLKYLYTGLVEIAIEDAIKLLDLANSYLEDELKQKCAHIIKNEIIVENVCSVYLSAVKYNLTELKECCLSFAAKNILLVQQTDDYDKTKDADFLKELSKRALKLKT